MKQLSRRDWVRGKKGRREKKEREGGGCRAKRNKGQREAGIDWYSRIADCALCC